MKKEIVKTLSPRIEKEMISLKISLPLAQALRAEAKAQKCTQTKVLETILEFALSDRVNKAKA